VTKPEDDGFLSRWSARKRQGTRATDVPDDATAESVVAARDHAPDPEKSDAEILEELELPDPDTLMKGDDFSKFMTSAVPARLRNRALRRLWLTDPVLANLDEMVDYGEDFTDAATVVENMKTVYDSVRGMMPEETEEADIDGEASEDDAASDSQEIPDAAEDGTIEDGSPLADAAEIDMPPSAAREAESAVAFQHNAKDTPPPRPQRMRFRFEDG
jgi:hypothetical protein